jgi:hypothetical protein
VIGMGAEVAVELGDVIEVGVTTFHTHGEPSRELLFVNPVGAPVVAMTKPQALALAHSIIEATDMLEAQ